MKYTIVITLLCLYSIQAINLATELNDMIIEITGILEKAESDFSDYTDCLLRHVSPYFKKANAVEADFNSFANTPRAGGLECTANLREALTQLNYQVTSQFAEHRHSSLKELFSIRDEFENLLRTCYGDLQKLNEFYSCSELKCQLELIEQAKAQLTRARNGDAVKDIRTRIKREILHSKDGIHAIAEEFQPKLEEIRNKLNSCKF